jgi:hypothetical protein
MERLSEQLNDLSVRTKKTEDVIDAARTRNRAALESQHATLQMAVDKAAARAANTGATISSKWHEMRSTLDGQFASMRAEVDERRAERDVKRAEHRADRAEQDAADVIDFALYALDQAEYAIVDAVLARADADALALQQ